MGNLGCHAGNILIDELKSKPFLVNITQHTIFHHVLQDVRVIPDCLGEIHSDGLQETNVGPVIMSDDVVQH